jgi:WD40 repeat protein
MDEQVTAHYRPSFSVLHTAGDLLLSGGRDGNVRVWDLQALCCRRTLTGHTADILHLGAHMPGFSLNGNNDACRTASGSNASGSSSSDLSSQDQLAGSETTDARDDDALQASARDAPGWDRAFLFASCSADGTCRLWSMQAWCCMQIICPVPGITQTTFSSLPWCRAEYSRRLWEQYT